MSRKRNVSLSEIEPVVSNLDLGEIDVLMQYIYYGFEHSVEGSSAYLIMSHNKTCNSLSGFTQG